MGGWSKSEKELFPASPEEISELPARKYLVSILAHVIFFASLSKHLVRSILDIISSGNGEMGELNIGLVLHLHACFLDAVLVCTDGLGR